MKTPRIKMAVFGLVGMLALALFSSDLKAQNPPEAELLLRRMFRANQTTPYRGDWVTEIDSLQIWQKIYQDGRGHRRIVFVLPRNLLGREILEIPPYLYVRQKEEAKFRRRAFNFHQRLFSKKRTPSDWALIRQNYRISVSPGQRILRRLTLEVQFAPVAADRPSMRIWVDAQTHLLLKLEKSWPEGGVILRSYFKNLLVNPVLDPAQFVLLPDQIDSTHFKQPAVFSSLDSLRNRIRFPLLLPGWLPAGFRFRRARLLNFHNHEIVHLIYFDGLGTLSLFESLNGTHRSGGTYPKKHADVWEYHATIGPVGVFLLGGLRPRTLEKVLASLPEPRGKSTEASRRLVLWVGILVVALILMTQFLTGKRRSR